MARRNESDLGALPEMATVELLGTHAGTGMAGAETKHQQIRRAPRRSSILAAGVAIAALAFVVASGPTPSDEADSSREPAPPRVLPDPERSEPDDRVAAEEVAASESMPRAARPEPVAPGAEGIVLIAGRGLEKVFIDLGTGERMVVDVDGVPIAAVDGFVALAQQADTPSSELCWFDLERRRCQSKPPTLSQLIGGAFPDSVDVERGDGDGGGPDVVELGLVQQLDLDAVLELRALSFDARWSATWVGGQLVVTDQLSGEKHTVQGVTRTYFEDGLALVG